MGSALLLDANANWRFWSAGLPRRAPNSVSSILVADPGMGKSRLLHEFRQRIGKESAFVLSGSCSPDGQQTPFLPFIEVVRGSFRISAGEAENEIMHKNWRWGSPHSACTQPAISVCCSTCSA